MLPNEPITPETMAGRRRSEFKLSQKNINATLIQIQRITIHIQNYLVRMMATKTFLLFYFWSNYKRRPSMSMHSRSQIGTFLINNFCLWFSCGVLALLLFPVLSTLMNVMPVTYNMCLYAAFVYYHNQMIRSFNDSVKSVH